MKHTIRNHSFSYCSGLILLLCMASYYTKGANPHFQTNFIGGNENLSPLNFSKGKLSTGDSLKGKAFTCKNEWIEIREEFQDSEQCSRIIADGVSYRKNHNRPQLMIPEPYTFDIAKLNRVTLIRKWKKHEDYIVYSEFILPDQDLVTPYQILDPNTGNVYDSTDQYGNLVFPPLPKASSFFRIYNLKTGKTIELNNVSFFMQSGKKIWISYFDTYFGQYPLFSLYDLETEQYSFERIPAGELWKHQQQLATYPELKNTKIISTPNKGLNPENTCTIVFENNMALMNMINLQTIPSGNYEWFRESIGGLRMVYAKEKFGIEDENHTLLFPLSSDSIAIWTESFDHEEQVWTKIYHNGNVYHYVPGYVPVLEKKPGIYPYRYRAQSTAHKNMGYILFARHDASELLNQRPYISVFADGEMMDSLDAMGNPVYPPKPPVEKEIQCYDLRSQMNVVTDSTATRINLIPRKNHINYLLENINRFEPYAYQLGSFTHSGNVISKDVKKNTEDVYLLPLDFLGYSHQIQSISLCPEDSTKLKIKTSNGVGIYDLSQARWLILPQYENIRYLEPFQSYLLICAGKMGMTDSWGTPIFPTEYQSITFDAHKDYFILDEHYFVYRNPQYSALRGIMHEEEVVQTRGVFEVNQPFLEAKNIEGRILLSYGNRVVGPLEVFDPETGDQFLIEDTKEIISKYGYKQYGINEEIGKRIYDPNMLNKQFEIELRNGYFLCSNPMREFYLYNSKWECFDSAKLGMLTIQGSTTLVQGGKQIAWGNASNEVVDASYDAAMYTEAAPYSVVESRLYHNSTLLSFPDGFIPFRLPAENLVHAVKKESQEGKEILRHQLFYINQQQQLIALDPSIDVWSLVYQSTGKSMVLGNTNANGEIRYQLLDVSKNLPTTSAPFSADLFWKGETIAYFLEKTDQGYDLYSSDKQLIKSGLPNAPIAYLATDSTLHFEISGKWYAFLNGKETVSNAPLQNLYFGENEMGRLFFYKTQNEKIEIINHKGESLAISNWHGNNHAELHTAEGLENSYFLRDTLSKKNYLMRWTNRNQPEFVFSEPVDSFRTIYANSDTRVIIWTKGETHVCDQYWNVLMTLPYTAETKNSELGLSLLLLRPKSSTEPYCIFHPTSCQLTTTTYPDKGIDLNFNSVENQNELWVTGMENNVHMIYSYRYDGTLQLTSKKAIAKGNVRPLPFASYWVSKDHQGELYYLGPEYEFRDTFAFQKLTLMSDNVHFVASDKQNKTTRFYQLTAEEYIEIPFSDLDSAMEYGNSSIIQIWKNNKCGLYFPNVKKILPPVYTQVVGPYNESMHLITCDGNLVSTLTGEIIFNNSFKRCEFPEGKYLLSQHQDGTWWICNNQPNSDNFLIKKQLPVNIKKWIGFAGVEDWHKFMDHSGMVGIYNVKTEEWILQPKYKDVRVAYAGNTKCYFFSNGSYWGVCDSTGKIILPDTFDSIDLQEAYPSGQLYLTTRKNGQYALFNLNGKALLPGTYPEIEGGNFPIVMVTNYTRENETAITGLFDVSKGKWLYPISKVDYVFTEDEQGKKVIYVEQNGKRIKVIYP